VQEERPFSTCGVAEQVVAAGRLIPAISSGDACGIALPQDARRFDIHPCRLSRSWRQKARGSHAKVVGRAG